jgi:hypothetical protein
MFKKNINNSKYIKMCNRSVLSIIRRNGDEAGARIIYKHR